MKVVKPTDIEVIMDVLKIREYKELLNKVPLNSFFSIQRWPTIQQKLQSYVIIMLYRSILMHSDISIDPEKNFAMQIGKLHHLSSGSLQVGYLIELPKKIKLIISNSTVSATVGKVLPAPTSVADVPPAQHDYINKHLSVYVQNTSQLIACHSNQINFL